MRRNPLQLTKSRQKFKLLSSKGSNAKKGIRRENTAVATEVAVVILEAQDIEADIRRPLEEDRSGRTVLVLMLEVKDTTEVKKILKREVMQTNRILTTNSA